MAKKDKTGGRKQVETTPIQINNITVGQLTRGNQTVQTWINAVKQAESELVPDRRSLYNTYLDVTIDGYLDSLMDKRIRAILTTPFHWQGLEDEKYKENLSAPWFTELMKLMGQRIFWGTTLAELKVINGLVEDVTMIPRQNVKPEKAVIMLDGYSDVGNVIYYKEGIYPNYILEIGRTRELGKLANVAAYILMKRANLSDLSRYNEMFGMDLRVYEYDPNKPGARVESEASAKEYGSAAYIVIPRGYADVKFIASNKQSSSSAYETLHNILKNEITISILGETLTTGGEGGGSYELGKVHQNVSAQVALEDRMAAEYIINYPLKKMLMAHGYPLEGVKGVFKVPDTLAKEIKAQMWINLANAGLPIAKEDFYQEFGIPMPEAREVLTPPAKPAPMPNPDGPADPGAKGKGEAGNAKPAGGAGAKKLSAALHDLYQHKCTRDKSPMRVSLSYKTDLENIIERIINQLRTGELSPGDVDAQLYNSLAKELFKGVEKGYGIKLEAATEADKVMLQALRENVYRFSGAKTYNFIREANALLVDAEGQVKPFNLFREDVLKLNEQYNIDFLRTEYNHAVASSRMASKWQKFDADKNALPLLQFDTVGDGRVRVAHQALDGIIKPVDDPFWNTFLPPLDWNCRCSVRQLADGEVTITDTDKLPQVKDEFKYNWGKERFIFPPNHPQFTVDPADQASADDNFGLPLPV